MSRLVLNIITLICGFIGCFILFKIMNYKDKKEKNKQRTFVYCPKCNNELVKNGYLIKDIDFVYYKCSKCGYESKWDFDLPCPILIVNSLQKCDKLSKNR